MQRFSTSSILAAVWLLAATAVLIGCKTEDAKPVASNFAPVVAHPSMAPVSDTRPAIVCFGDSITAGLGVEPAVNYPADLQHELDTRGYRYRVANLGVSGETTKKNTCNHSSIANVTPAEYPHNELCWAIAMACCGDRCRGVRKGEAPASPAAVAQ